MLAPIEPPNTTEVMYGEELLFPVWWFKQYLGHSLALPLNTVLIRKNAISVFAH